MKRILATTAVLGLAIAGIGTASAQPAVQKVTGGGQIAADQMTGPGQTLAFNARASDNTGVNNADGQFQFNAHDEAGTKFHGTITCLQVSDADEGDPNSTADDMPAMATLAGTYDTADGPASFKLTIMDVDRGQAQNQNEPLTFQPEGADSADCEEPAMSADMQLGRGNIVIHKEKAPRP